MIEIGATFIAKPPSSKKEHLYIVISDPASTKGLVVFVNITSFSEKKDQQCVLEAGDHVFIKHRSVVNFAEARACEVNKIIDALSKRIFSSSANASGELLAKIQLAFLASPHTAPAEKQLVRESMSHPPSPRPPV